MATIEDFNQTPTGISRSDMLLWWIRKNTQLIYEQGAGNFPEAQSRTVSKTTSFVNGSVAAGARSVEFITSADFDGSIAGDGNFGAVRFKVAAPLNDTLQAIPYEVNFGSIQIITVT